MKKALYQRGFFMNIFTGISRLERCQQLALINGLALWLADGLNDDDLNAFSNILTAAGALLLTFAGAPEAGTLKTDSGKKEAPADGESAPAIGENKDKKTPH